MVVAWWRCGGGVACGGVVVVVVAWQRCGRGVVVVWCGSVVVVWRRRRGSAVVDGITVVFSRQCSRWWRCCSRLGLVLHTSACPASLDAFRTQIQATSQQEQDTHLHCTKTRTRTTAKSRTGPAEHTQTPPPATSCQSVLYLTHNPTVLAGPLEASSLKRVCFVVSPQTGPVILRSCRNMK